MIVMARNHYNHKLLLYNLNQVLVLFVFFYSVQQGNIPEQKCLFQYKKKLFSVQKMLFPVRKYTLLFKFKFMEKYKLVKNPSPRWDLNPQPSVINQIKEGRGFKFHLGLRIFSKFVFLHEFEFTFHIMLFLQYKTFYSQYKNIAYQYNFRGDCKKSGILIGQETELTMLQSPCKRLLQHVKAL